MPRKPLTMFDPIPRGLRADGNVCTLRSATPTGAKHKLVVGMNGAGKALALDTPIPTPSGWATMGELRDGDEVFDDRGEVCRVVTAWPVRHGRPCYDVQFSDGSAITADEDHLWRVDRDGGEAAVMTTFELRRCLRNEREANYSIRVAGALDTPHDMNLPIHPYLLGLWLARGDLDAARLGIDEWDTTEVAKRLNVLGYQFNTADRSVEGAQDIEREMGSLGLFHHKRIPIAYLRASIAQRWDLLAGLLDAGGVVESWGSILFTTPFKTLSRDVRNLIASLGHVALLGKISIIDKVTLAVRFMPDRQVFTIARKATRHAASVRAPARRRSIIDIIPVKTVPVRCITVDSPSRLYLAGDQCVPTHNTVGEVPTLIVSAARGATLIVVDLEKLTQSYGDLAPIFQWMISDEGLASALMARILSHTIPDRADQLAREGLKKWTPASSLDFIVLQIEEAWKFADSSDLIDLAVTLRSVGIQLVVSVQRATFDRVATSLRSELPYICHYGINSEKDNRYGLPDDLVDAGANPARWKNSQPGMHYVAQDGVPLDEQLLPVRAWADPDELDPGHPQSFKLVAGRVGVNLRPPHLVTTRSFGKLWEARVPPVEMMAKRLSPLTVAHPVPTALIVPTPGTLIVPASALAPTAGDAPTSVPTEEGAPMSPLAEPAPHESEGRPTVVFSADGTSLIFEGDGLPPDEVYLGEDPDPSLVVNHLVPIPDIPAEWGDRDIASLGTGRPVGEPNPEASPKPEYEAAMRARLAELMASGELIESNQFYGVQQAHGWSRPTVLKWLEIWEAEGLVVEVTSGRTRGFLPVRQAA